MKGFWHYILLVCLLAGCADPEVVFETLPSGVQYAFVERNEDGEFANAGDAWVLDVQYYSDTDSLLFDSRSVTSKFTMECPADSMIGCVEEALHLIHSGDSMIIKVDAERFFAISRGIEMPDFIKRGSLLTFYVRCNGVVPKSTLEQQFGEYISKMMANEKMLISNYIEREQIATVPSPTGLYKIVLKPGSGKQTAANKTVTVHYVGMFVEGTEFDNSYKRNKPLTFKLGEDLVIPGWEEGIATMKKGEKARLVCPSNLAYGPEGTKGIPPFSTLVFDIEMIDFK